MFPRRTPAAAARPGLRRPDAAADRAALPDSLRVVPPGSEVPAALAAFSGVWSGAWDGVAPSRIAVERVSPDGRALVIVAAAAHPVLGPATSTVVRARVRDGALRFRLGADGPDVALRLTAPGVMTAQGRRAGGAALGGFRREGLAAEAGRMAAAGGLGYGPAR